VNNDKAKNDKYLYRGLLGEITHEGGILFLSVEEPPSKIGAYEAFTEAITAIKSEADNHMLSDPVRHSLQSFTRP
jgi:hypothetical protein